MLRVSCVFPVLQVMYLDQVLDKLLQKHPNRTQHDSQRMQHHLGEMTPIKQVRQARAPCSFQPGACTARLLCKADRCTACLQAGNPVCVDAVCIIQHVQCSAVPADHELLLLLPVTAVWFRFSIPCLS